MLACLFFLASSWFLLISKTSEASYSDSELRRIHVLFLGVPGVGDVSESLGLKVRRVNAV